jgi:hypothetical protein
MYFFVSSIGELPPLFSGSAASNSKSELNFVILNLEYVFEENLQ